MTWHPFTALFQRRRDAVPWETSATHEVFTREQLERHARDLAHFHGTTGSGGGNRLLVRLGANAALIEDAYGVLRGTMTAGLRAPPAAEWVVDNMHLVRSQVITARRHLPQSYNRRLPRLRHGPHAGLPRVYSVAYDFISHADGRVDPGALSGFIAAYQEVACFTLGELWAIPIMLRLALIENIARIAERVREVHQRRMAAARWAERLITTAESLTADLVIVLAEMAREERDPSGAFIAELIRRIQGQNTAMAMVIGWIEGRLAERGSSIEATVLAETHSQATDQLSASITIGSLRALDEVDWREFVESSSVVERILRGDADGTYPRMDERTRDHYRHAVEEIAHGARREERLIALAAVDLALAAPAEEDRQRHVGYWLIGRGRETLARTVGTPRGPVRALAGWFGRHPLPPLIGTLCGLAIAGGLSTAWCALPPQPAWWTIPLMSLAAVLAASQPAMSLVAWLWSRFLASDALPRLDLRAGIPIEHRALVAVPTMLRQLADIGALIDALEVRYLACPDANLRFALLTDFVDAPAATMPDDEELLAAAVAGVEGLNRRHARSGRGPFLLLHRPRLHNPSEGCWMGRERKRGKLEDLNALILDGNRAAFASIVGDAGALVGMRYVITLDTDTQLPPGAARALVATMAHPLNRPRIDPRTRRVIEGHALLQPRVAISTASAARSLFARISAPEPGLDSYTGVSADLWQDLCGQGSFVGKGIYDVAAFATALSCRFPDNAVLSHDLIEGCYARSGLVSDVAVVEDQPARLLADAARRHRWMRGDWQIAGWALPWTRDGKGRRTRNVLSALGRWKIADNLRRALVAPATMLLILIDLLIGSGGFALVILLGLWLATPAVGALLALPRRPQEVRWRAHAAVWFDNLVRQLASIGMWLAFIPFEAVLALDAMVVAAVRMLITRRRLLEWQTSGEAERLARADLAGVHHAIWACPVTAAAVVTVLLALDPARLWSAAPLALLWILAPTLAWWLSRPLPSGTRPLAADDRLFLCSAARITWRYFETFVGPDEHWLPPDNVQEHPVASIAHRTSPTNIGFALLADLAALDLGYQTTEGMLDRIANTLGTMERLERHRGHFLNWYDTRTLAPLVPRYVSTVDSGNLAGALAVLAQGLVELDRCPVDPECGREGLRHAVTCLRHAAKRQEAVETLADAIDQQLQLGPGDLGGAESWFAGIAGLAESGIPAAKAHGEETAWWLAAVARQARAHERHFAQSVPWARWQPVLIALPAEVPAARREAVENGMRALERSPTPAALADSAREVLLQVRGLCEDPALARDAAGVGRLGALAEALAAAARNSLRQCERAQQLAARATALAEDMDFTSLYDQRRRLFTIGMHVEGERLDRNCYDLLASEARLTSYLAVARGLVPLEHWFALGRPLTVAERQPTLVSWSGSMFEYLMPDLLMPCFADSLLDRTNRAMVARQIAYGREQGVPWGISESGYNLTDAAQQWQYRGFGVPGLGLKRGLAEDLVVAPYASALALLVDPHAAVANLRRMANDGLSGRYGFYEAVDFTPSRLSPEARRVVVRSWMVHHQGMALLSFLHVIGDAPMRRRFCADPALRAVSLLLQERAPLVAPETLLPDEDVPAEAVADLQGPAVRSITNPNTPQPEVALLSNGRYHVLLTAAGGGVSRWKEHAVNRWREDLVRDGDGLFCYMHDVEHGEVWSNTYQPTLQPSRSYEAVFSHARVEFRRRDHDIEVVTEIAVSSEDDVELRRLTIHNRSGSERVLELTSCAEVVVGSAAADAAHPAFSGLFVQTEIDQPRQALFCRRRPRRAGEIMPVLVHLMTVHDVAVGPPSFETDRARFIGRDRSLAAPAALDRAGPLSGTSGAVLDPIAAIRRRITMEPGASAVVDLVWGMADDEVGARALAERYRDRHLTDRVFGLAWGQSRLLLHQLGLNEVQAQAAARLAGALVLPTAFRRAPPGVVALNRRAQPALWAHGVSGDLPIALVRIADPTRLDLVREIISAHAWWRAKGLMVDLVLWNEDASGYRQALHDQLLGLVAAGPATALVDKPGGVFVRRADFMSDEDRILFQSSARLVLTDTGGSLVVVAERRPRPERPVERLEPVRTRRPDNTAPVPMPQGLRFANGLGGFTAAGDEYVIVMEPGRTTPAPWVNVLANPGFGAVVSASGSGYTWAENSHEFRITPWSGDAVTDASGEAFYLRDEETGAYWSPTPWPARAPTRYIARHGFGSSSFSVAHDGLESELTTFVASEGPVRFYVWRIANRTANLRRITLTACCELALGELRQRGAMHVISDVDRATGTLTARNPFNADFGGRVVFLDASVRARSYTADRGEFLGRNGIWAQPDALARKRLGGRIGACLDPCLALQVPCDLAPGQEREVVFVLGCGNDAAAARDLALRWRDPGAARSELKTVRMRWRELLGRVRIESEDAALDLLANGWLLYQTIACRMWGRSGFYQSGGAYGFRDQLQDAMATVQADNRLLREQIVRAASRQFVEGDVQHWWHPPGGRGVRTHCSDDLLWLPLAVCHYVEATGDHALLEATAPFLTSRPLRPEEGDIYELPGVGEHATVYEHCLRALGRASGRGAHGLPLIGTGDWNDGFDRLGRQGRGESVWLGFFLHQILMRFSRIADRHGDSGRAERMRGEAAALAQALDAQAWDGAWYLRAFTDDGIAIGASTAEECRIDSLPQSWAVLSGAGDPARARTAMEEVDRRLVRRGSGLIQLFDPPFDRSALDPGYIRGYPPGVRENGGQYTHAAVWVAMAFARLGDAERAWELIRLLDPVRRGADPETLAVSRVEPYVLAADVYGQEPHTGRGGWTWYTGSAGWMYRLLVEELLGLRLRDGRLLVEPVLVTGSKGFHCTYRHGRATYILEVSRGARSTSLDGVGIDDHVIPLVDDGREHRVQLSR
jgi:cyclic beta-1,2-glucan synthetase